jgi:hypothetical protein
MYSINMFVELSSVKNRKINFQIYDLYILNLGQSFISLIIGAEAVAQW